MLNKPLNMQCPYCGQHQVEVINQVDPMSFNSHMGFNYHETTKSICMHCGKVIESDEKVTYSNSSDDPYTSVSCVDKYCKNCNAKMVQYDSWWVCPSCHYGQMDYTGDPPSDNIEINKKIFEDKLYIPCDNVWGVGKTAVTDQMTQNTLTIERCEKIKMHHKEMDIDFEFDIKKIENINTIIINGHKFVRENANGLE